MAGTMRSATRRRMIQAISIVAMMAGLSGVSCMIQPSPVAQPPQPPAPATTAKHQVAYGHLPLSFEANQGQTDPQVQFLSRGKGYSLFLTPTEAVLALEQVKAEVEAQTKNASRATPHASREYRQTVLRMKLLDTNPHPTITGLAELPGKANYFLGNDPSKWHTNVPTYAKVKYEQVYPGIDLIYYGNQRQLEYDLVVAPGADPNAITLAFEGADRLDVDAGGDLVLHVVGGEVLLHKPVVYQERDGVKQQIPGSYVRTGPKQVGFQVAAYDTSKPLVIDPVLSYSTYLGGSGGDGAYGIALDSSGSTYVTGFTASPDFPTANPLQPTSDGGLDVFVTKLTPDGTAQIYSTYLGGHLPPPPPFYYGSAGDTGYAIAVDASGNAYVAGVTTSENFPTANAFQPALRESGCWHYPRVDEVVQCADAFVAKLNATGSALVYSTYLGGTRYDEAYAIAVDAAGDAYVTGYTNSDDFPTANPFQPTRRTGTCRIYMDQYPCPDLFVAKFSADGSALVYSTYLGGSDWDSAHGIAVDTAGNAYVTGKTRSGDFPTASPLQQARGSGTCPVGSEFPPHPCPDAFMAKLDPSRPGPLSLVYSTYLGGNSRDEGHGIAVDAAGAAYVTGWTNSTDFPIANALQPACGVCPDAFVTKVNPEGSAFVYSTYLGGSHIDEGHGIAVDTASNAYVTGGTQSPDFPIVNALQPAFGGGACSFPPLYPPYYYCGDAFVTKVNPEGSAHLYSTYLGGNSPDTGSGIAMDTAGTAYVTGFTASPNFPTVNAMQPALNGSGDAFIVSIADPPPPDTTPTTATITSPANLAIVSGTVTVSAEASDNVGVAAVQFQLDGAPLGAEDTEAPYAVTWDTTTAAIGPHTLTAVARDAAGNHGTAAPVTVIVVNLPGVGVLP